MTKIILKKPIELSSSVRDADGVPLAFAKTVEGGSAVVVWKNASWVLVPEGSFTVSDVMKSPEMRTSVRFSKTLNEYIFYGKPESQLPSEMKVSDHQLNLLKKYLLKK